MINGIKNEANVRQMVQDDLQTIEDKIDSLGRVGAVAALLAVMSAGPLEKDQTAPSQNHGQELVLDSTTTFCQERWNSKKGWVRNNQPCSIQGFVGAEKSNFIKDMHQMVLDKFKNNVNWEQTTTEQGTWPTKQWSLCGSAVRKNQQTSSLGVSWLQTTLLKEKVLEEKDGLSSRKVLQEFVQSCPDSCLTARDDILRRSSFGAQGIRGLR